MRLILQSGFHLYQITFIRMIKSKFLAQFLVNYLPAQSNVPFALIRYFRLCD